MEPEHCHPMEPNHKISKLSVLISNSMSLIMKTRAHASLAVLVICLEITMKNSISSPTHNRSNIGAYISSGKKKTFLNLIPCYSNYRAASFIFTLFHFSFHRKNKNGNRIPKKIKLFVLRSYSIHMRNITRDKTQTEAVTSCCWR